MKRYGSVLLTVVMGLLPGVVLATDHCVRPPSECPVKGDGSTWSCASSAGGVGAYSGLPAHLVRGDTYHIADGSYGSYTFDDPVEETRVITVKKATQTDHGTTEGWQGSFGNGQAILGSRLWIAASYYTIEGNGAHILPSDDTNDYGFKVDSDCSTCTAGIVRIGTSSPVSHVTLRYTHVYNTTNGSINNGTISVRFYGSGPCTYIKLQNNFFENCGQDGLALGLSDLILVERNYIKRLGRRYTGTTPCSEDGATDCHGQTVMMFVSNTDVIFRWNTWEANEGQSLIAYGAAGGTDEQTDLPASIFADYPGDDFTLAGPTAAGLRLSSRPWWRDGPDDFFGQLDHDTDMYGNRRGADGVWDRGAYEFVGRRPGPPEHLRVDR